MRNYMIGILVLIIYGTGCSKKDSPSPTPTSVHLINRYDDPQEMIFGKWGTNTGMSQPVSYLSVKWSVFSAGFRSPDLDGCWITEQSQPERFDSLVRAHSDTHWNREKIDAPYMFRVTTGLHVVCDGDYDAAHPTGTPLDDILTVHYYTADHILINGEYILGKTEQQRAKNYSLEEFDAPLTEFNKMRLKLLMMSFAFWPDKAPDKTGDYVFTCTYTNEDGKELTASTDPIRIQGRH